MIYKQIMHIGICDCCGAEWESTNGMSAFVEQDILEESMIDDMWKFGNSEHLEGTTGEVYCPSCYEYDFQENFILLTHRRDINSKGDA